MQPKLRQNEWKLQPISKGTRADVSIRFSNAASQYPSPSHLCLLPSTAFCSADIPSIYQFIQLTLTKHGLHARPRTRLWTYRSEKNTFKTRLRKPSQALSTEEIMVSPSQKKIQNKILFFKMPQNLTYMLKLKQLPSRFKDDKILGTLIKDECFSCFHFGVLALLVS